MSNVLSSVSISDFYCELEHSLATSTGEQRKKWATIIIANAIELKELCGLLQGDQKTATRFLWLISDIGIANPEKLHIDLPYLLDFCTQLTPEYAASFASYWLYAGVPVDQEGKAIDLLFQLFMSGTTTVTIKSRALLVLAGLAKKYPELKPELRSCIIEQMNNYSKDFQKRAAKVLRELVFL